MGDAVTRARVRDAANRPRRLSDCLPVVCLLDPLLRLESASSRHTVTPPPATHHPAAFRRSVTSSALMFGTVTLPHDQTLQASLFAQLSQDLNSTLADVTNIYNFPVMLEFSLKSALQAAFPIVPSYS